MSTRVANALALFSNVFQHFQTTTFAAKIGASAVGPSARRVGRSSAERGRKVEPKAVRNKGIFRGEPTKRRCERLKVGRREIVGKSRQSRRRSERTKTGAQFSPARKRSRRRRSTRTAEPRVERRKIASRARVSPPPVPTRVSIIKYLALGTERNRGKFYLFSLVQKSRRRSRRFRAPSIFSIFPYLTISAFPILPSLRKPAVLPVLTSSSVHLDSKNLFKKIYSPPFSKRRRRV